jgi:hypothetical protein
MYLLQKLFLALLFLISIQAYSQSSVSPNKSSVSIWGRNDIRVGFYATRASIAYDRVITDKLSIGIEGLRHFGWSTFPGYSFSILGRHYFKAYNQSGFFIEEKITYGHYTPVVYDSVKINSADEFWAYGQHTGHLNYFGNTFSGGYRAYAGKYFFVEFLTGLRLGIIATGKNDNAMLMAPEAGTGPSAIIYSDFFSSGVVSDNPTPQQVFNSIGPGFPIYFNIRVGVKF